jgi:tape measure domain-containing protein
VATTRFIDIKVRTRQAEAGIKRLDGKTKALAVTAKATKESFFNLSKVAAAIGAALATNQIIKYADAFTSVQNQIRQTVKTTEQLTKSTEDLFAVANRARVGITATTELYTQLTLSTENLNLTTKETLRLTETIAKSFSVSGKTAAESAGAIRQLGQAFAAGALRGDEFNSIAEGAPEIMRALQRSLNKTQGELRAFAATGGITAEILVTALSGAAEVIDKKLSDSVVTFAQSIEIANNNMTKFIGESESVQSTLGGAGSALVAISENLDKLASISVVLAAVYAARLTPALITYTTSIVANTIAQATQTVAVTGVSASLGVQAVALTRTAIAANVLTGSARLLTGALAFLGGPIGVALIAATALFAFTDIAWETDESSTSAAKGVDSLTNSFDRMSQAAKKTTLNKLNKEMEEVRVELIRASDALRQFQNFADSPIKTQSITRYKNEIEELNSKLDALSDKQGLLIGGPDLSGGTSRGTIGDEQESPDIKESAFSQRLSQETEALQRELNLRNAIQFGFLSEEEAALSLNFLNKQARSEMLFEAEIIKLGTDEEAKSALRLQFKESQALEEELFQQNLTAIELSGADTRAQNEINANNLVVASKKQSQQALLGLISAFAGKSKTAAIALLAVSKGLAIAQTISGSIAGAAKVYGELPYPAAVVASGQILAQGKISAGLIAATGLAQGAGILSGSSGVSSSASIGGSASVNTGQATTPTVTQGFTSTEVIENTALTELTNELANRDPDEMLPVSWIRRLTASIESVQSSGQV